MSDELAILRNFVNEFGRSNDENVHLRQGVVTGYDSATARYEVQLGEGSTPVPEIASIAPAAIAVGQTVWLIKSGALMLILGKQWTG